MIVKTIEDVEEFLEAVKKCNGPVYLTDWKVDTNGNYNFSVNLKSPLSTYIGIEKLLSDEGDWMEVHCSTPQDDAIIMEFLKKNKEQYHDYYQTC